MTTTSKKNPSPNQSTPNPVPSTRTTSSPLALAVQHLRSRKVAMVCFGILVIYFALTLATYLRLPGESSFIGEWFEAKAGQQHYDPLGNPLNHYPPQFAKLTFEPDGRQLTPEIIANYQSPPRSALIFGTDIQGRSTFWRTLYGTRISITIAIGASILALTIGTTLGALAGYFGGWVDITITWLFTTVASVPRILLILALAYSLKEQTITFFGHEFELAGVPMLILAMGLTSWVGLCRIVRGEIIKQKSMDYESAARSIGMSRARILIHHLLPNAFFLVIIQASLIFPLFIHLEVILSYLGLGIDAKAGVSWGQMINESLQEIIRNPPVWWQLLAATVAIFGISIALNLFGDALRDALDPKLQSRND